MSPNPLALAANANLRVTYARLALATPQTECWKQGSFEGCFSPTEHPICNYGLGSKVPLDEISNLRNLAKSRKYFHFYLLPGLQSEVATETLRRGGFRELYSLTEMLGPTHSNGQAFPAEPVAALSPESRQIVGRFVTNQFFSRQPIPFREAVTEATARAIELELYARYEGEENEPIAAIMLSASDSPTQGGMLGIYSLCVEPIRQGDGLGRELVAWAVGEAQKRGLPPVLQCDPHLAPWYESQGFTASGTIRAFRLEG